MGSRLLLFVILSFVNAIFSQEERKTFKLANSKYTNIYSHYDSNENLILLFLKGKKGEYKYLNNKYELVYGRSFNVSKFDTRSDFIGMTNERNYLRSFFINIRKKTVYSLAFDKQSVGEPFFNIIYTMNQGENFVTSLNCQEKFYLVTHLINTDLLYLIALDPTGEVLKKEVKTGVKNLSGLLSKDSYSFDFAFSQYSVDHADAYDHNPFLKSASEKKAFLFGKKLTLLIDEPGKTHVFEINLLTASLLYKLYHFHLDRCTDERIVSGVSNFYSGYLFRLTYCRDQLNLSIIETDSSILRRNFNVYNDEAIDFKNTIITQTIDHDGYKDPEINIVENSNKFLRVLDDLKLAISFTKLSSDQLSVRLGGVRQSVASFYNPASARSGSSPFGLSLGVGMGLGSGGFGIVPGIGMSPFGNPMMGTTQNYIRTNMVSFTSLINFPMFDHLDGNPTLTLHEKAIKFSQSKGGFAEVLGVIHGNENKILYGYLSGKDDLYHIVEFTR